MFGADAENVVFTKNCTEALNCAIKGSVKSGEHIVISSLEHNSVARVVEKLSDSLIADYSVAPFCFNPEETLASFEKAIKRNTTLVVCTLASNVFGVILPVREIGALCKKRGIRFIVDAAQGAGIYPLNLNDDNIDILCAPGHKCLMGPMGTGFFIMKKGVRLEPLTEGGTGNRSLSYKMPVEPPERFEAGTLNNPGIIGLGAGIKYINSLGAPSVLNRETELIEIVYRSLAETEKAVLYTPVPKSFEMLPVLSFNIKGMSSESVAAYLAENGVCVRAGYHCAPLAHRHFNTLDGGTVRVSMGCFNTKSECYRFIKLVKKL